VGIVMRIDRLSPLDRFMLRVSRTWPQDIGALAILDGAPLTDSTGRFRLEAARAAIEERLHLAPRFRQVIVFPKRGLGPPFWADVREFDLSAHVHELPLEPPIGEAELLAAVEQLRRQPLESSRPMWEMWFLTGLPDGRVAWFVKLHHTMGDGMAAMTTIAALLDRRPLPPRGTAPAWRRRRMPLASELVADNLRRRIDGLGGRLRTLARPGNSLHKALAAWPAIRELLAEQPATKTSLDRMIGLDRNLAVIRTSLDAVRSVGRSHGATVNDVLLAATAAGLRSLLQRRGEPVDGTTIRVYVPVSLRRRLRGAQQGNLIAQMAVPLHLGEGTPELRLRRIAAETARRKARLRMSLGALMHGGALGRRLMLALVMRQRVNLATTSIPGPKRALYLAGAPVLEVFPIVPLVANEPLAVGALSYAGTLSIGIVADRDTFPDVDVFTSAARDELAALGIPAPLAELGGITPWPPEAAGTTTAVR
jgi:diacylglycerol O-acyltransferase / wax synthase